MTTLRYLILFCLLTTPLMAQTEQTAMLQTTRDRINFSGLAIPSTGVLFGFDGSPGQLVGDAYLDTTFQAGNVRFYGRIGLGKTDSLAGVPLRYDMRANEVEIRAASNDIRVAKGPSVRYFAVNNRLGTVSLYVNVREFRGEADELLGFFESIQPGKLSLLLHPFVTVKKATYNPALNVGSKDEQILKKTTWYVAQNSRATKFTPNRKALLALMADKQEQIEAFLKEKDPDLKSRSGLMAVFAYYSSL